ncbi:MAG: VWA domain-containing protein [Gemmatales bacterium]
MAPVKERPESSSLLAWIGFWAGLSLLLLSGLALALALTSLKEWLETTWGITFPTPLPVAYWWGMLGLGITLLLLYFLKLRRQRLTVSSTFLWKKSIEDLHVNSLFQWLKKNFLLLLQLLGLAGIAYSLAAPTTYSDARGRHFIFLVDNSASMASSDVAPTRLDEAKKKVKERVDAMDTSDQAMVILFNEEAQILQSYTNRKSDLKAAIDRIPQTQRTTRLQAALELAEGQANPRRSAEEGVIEDPSVNMARSLGSPEGVPTDVIIFSDGQFPDVNNFSLGKLRPALVTIGAESNNVGITWANLKREENRPDQFEVTVRVQNFGKEPIKQGISLQLETFAYGDRVDVQLKRLQLGARTRQERDASTSEGVKYKQIFDLAGATEPEPLITFTVKDPGQGYLKITLMDADKGALWNDTLPSDNTVWLAITPVRKARILRVGPANEILDAYFTAAGSRERAVITTIDGSDLTDKNETYKQAIQTEAFDLVIFDRVAPATTELMPQANTFFIGQCPPFPGGTWNDLPTLRKLFVKDYRTGHPLFSGIETLQGMTVDEARAIPLEARPKRASALVESQREPLLWNFGRDRYTDLVMMFPLVQGPGGNIWNTNWPRQPAGTLPLFLDNVVLQLGRYQEIENPIKPGVNKLLSPGSSKAEVIVKRVEPTSANFNRITRKQGQDVVFGETDQVGLYEANWGERQPFRFSVNLFDQDESNVATRDSVRIGYETVKAEQAQVKTRRELWPWFAGLALLALLIEWVFYVQRIRV